MEKNDFDRWFIELCNQEYCGKINELLEVI